MGVRILHDTEQETAVLYCSTTDWAFGPVVGESKEFDKDPVERLEAFTTWLREDPRRLNETELSAKYSAWRSQEADQYARERLDELARDEQEWGVLFEVTLPNEFAELSALRTRLGVAR